MDDDTFEPSDFELVDMGNLTPDEVAKFDQNLAIMKNWIGQALHSIQQHRANEHPDCAGDLCVGEEAYDNVVRLFRESPQALLGILTIALATLAPIVIWYTPEQAMELGLNSGDTIALPPKDAS